MPSTVHDRDTALGETIRATVYVRRRGDGKATPQTTIRAPLTTLSAIFAVSRGTSASEATPARGADRNPRAHRFTWNRRDHAGPEYSRATYRLSPSLVCT